MVLPDITGISQYLAVLGLNTTRMPTVKEYRAAYREKLKLHPDLGGGDTESIKSVTEAARYIFQFITEHSEHQTRKNTDKDNDLLKTFEAENNVTYNQGNIVFNIKASEADVWINCLRKKVGDPVDLTDGSGVIMKMDHFKIPAVSYLTKADYGSVIVTVYPNPKTSHPKIMVQGKMFIAFVTFIIPIVIQDMQAATALPLANGVSPAIGSGEQTDSDSDSDGEEGTRGDLERINQSFKRMETEVITLRGDLVDRVNTALSQNIGPEDITKINSRIDKLESLFKTNLEQTITLSTNIDKLNTSIQNKGAGERVTLEASQVEMISRGVTDHLNIQELSTSLSALRTEVAKASEVEFIKQIVTGVASITADVLTTTNKIDKQVLDLAKATKDTTEALTTELNQIRLNSDKSLPIFDAMKASLESIAPSASSSTPHTTPNPPSQTQPTENNKTRKGIMFSSSIALDTDVKRFKDELNCDLQIIPTYYVEHHPSAQDPDAYLQCMVNQHLAGKTGFDFVIIATGSNDITSLDTINSNHPDMYQKTTNQSQLLFETAQSLTLDQGLDVFLCEKPPRYDPESKDPTSMWQKLSRFSNGVISTSSLPAQRIILVEQSSLARTSYKARSDIFQADGLHLTRRGLNYFTNNIMSAMREYYGDIKQPDRSGDRHANNSVYHGHGDNRDRSDKVDRGDGYRGKNRNRGDNSWHQRGRRDDRSYGSHYDDRQGKGNHQPNKQRGDRGEDRNRGRNRYWDYNSDEGYAGGYERPYKKKY